MSTIVLEANPGGWVHLENLGVYGRIIFKRILKKWKGGMQIRFGSG
jgi:hypothetical protein